MTLILKSKTNQLTPINKGETWISLFGLPENRVLKIHQETSIEFALARAVSYLGLDPGLGKAVCAACISVVVGPPIVLITPPFLVENLTEEFRKWAPELIVKKLSKNSLELHTTDVLLVPDSILTRPFVRGALIDFRRMYGERDATIIVDEAHRFKNEKSQRTIACFDEIAQIFERKIFMSGTPMPNRPMELYPVLSRFAPGAIDHMSYFEFGKRYCAGFKGRFGWDFRGQSNMQELGARVKRDFMLRIKKDAVKLPPKIEEIFIISKDMSAQVAAMDRSIGKRYESADDVVRNAFTKNGQDDIHVATYRKLLALEKVRPTAEYLDALLSETHESILVFGIHIEAIECLAKAMAKHRPFVITGKTPIKDRQHLVNEFQACGLKRRLFLGNIDAMGVGLTLTKATRVILMEFSWVPGVNDQASDRAHRIGQESTVLVQYMVYKGSIDKKVLESNFEKRKSMRFV